MRKYFIAGALLSGAVLAASFTTDSLVARIAILFEETGAGIDRITVQAPSSISSAFTLTLPPNDGDSGDQLTSDGAGVMTWEDPGGGVPNQNVATETTTDTLTVSDDTVLADATSAAFTLTLPTAVGNTGKTFTIKKIDSTVNLVTIDGDGSETIDGDANRKLATQYESITLVSNNVSWSIANRRIPSSWASCTVTGTWVSNATYTCLRRRVGDNYEFNVHIAVTGTPTSAGLIITLPTGTTIDTAKLLATVGYVGFGNVAVYDVSGSGSSEFVGGRARYYSTTEVVFEIIDNNAAADHWFQTIDQITPMTFASGDAVSATFSIPVVGFGG